MHKFSIHRFIVFAALLGLGACASVETDDIGGSNAPAAGAGLEDAELEALRNSAREATEDMDRGEAWDASEQDTHDHDHDHDGHDHGDHDDHEHHDHEGHDHDDHEGHDHDDHEGHDHDDHEGHDHDDHEGHDHEDHDHEENQG